ncbi:ABC transporter substrate-binding protein [Paraburkholderia sp. BL21I4N1]|uniref:ABC transporter substrate-binding protein n=1 Tax=Paraburkholderia sp. BL21I4N1 TaxID=1938801 RepID=UPI000D4F7799|nr:ABC transporter substrate-binding protein [Paraburkholderia sp. BL21I4N1]PQV46771.1 iron complex transport system substrate-binding protein [Paraburkholderia sp. BL21I4N1]
MRRRDFLRYVSALGPLLGAGIADAARHAAANGTGATRTPPASLPDAQAAAAAQGAVNAAVSVKTPRLVVLDWGLVETLLALGVLPVGVAETAAYNDSVVTPRVPAQVTDVGLRLAPSLELLQQLTPDLILINSSQESQRAMLERIAPVRAFAVYTEAGAPYRHSQAITLELARLCGRAAAGQRLVDATQRALASCRARIAAYRARQSTAARARPLYLIRFFDGRHIGVYGAHSLFQDVMDALDVANAWQGPTDYWGIGVAGLEKLAAAPSADVLYFDPLPPGVARTLGTNRLWHALPAVAAGRVAALPPFWGFGMLPSAVRFAEALTAALTHDAATVAATAELIRGNAAASSDSVADTHDARSTAALKHGSATVASTSGALGRQLPRTHT